MHLIPDQPLISVIINCYNGEEYLKSALDSVLGQTYQNWELIFWDNRSTDSSAAIVDSYNDQRIRYFHAETHTDLGEARNEALMKASGEWVGFLDVDDIWFPQKLWRQVELISQTGDDLGLVYSRCEFFSDGINFGGGYRRRRILPGGRVLPEDSLASELFVGNLIPFPSVLYRRSALLSIGGVPKYKHPPDYYMSLAIALKWRARAIDDALCGYRLHQNNLSLQLKECGYLESIDIVRLLAGAHHRQAEAYHVVRLIMYLCSQQRWSEVRQQITALGFKGFLRGMVGLLRYTTKYSQNLF